MTNHVLFIPIYAIIWVKKANEGVLVCTMQQYL